jgi:hypothetical protein
MGEIITQEEKALRASQTIKAGFAGEFPSPLARRQSGSNSKCFGTPNLN